jgi:prophage regulatory protein
MTTRLLHLREVLNRTSLSRSTVYRLMGRGEFPQSVALGSRVSWVEGEVESWLQERIAAHREVAA